MDNSVIIFEDVCKTYPLYTHIKRGFKSFLLNIFKAYRDMKNSKIEVLKNLSFEIKRGESFGIVGKNGEGKSTILGLIAGVIKPTSGKVRVKGKVFSLLELGAGFHPELNGRENIILNGILLGLTKNEILERLDKIIEFSELQDFIDQPVRTYSSGMLARLGFSIISSVDPEILLIDEILAVGDIGFQNKCMERLMEFRKRNVTIVLVSHNLDTIKSICDRALWINNHSIECIGSPEEVIKKYSNSI